MGYGAVGALLAYAAVVGMLSGLKPFLGVLQDWTFGQLWPILLVQLGVGLAMTGMSARWAVGRYPVRASTDSCEPRRRAPLIFATMDSSTTLNAGRNAFPFERKNYLFFLLGLALLPWATSS